MQARMEALQNALLFDEVPTSELRALAALLREQRLASGEEAAQRGQPLAGMILVEEGALEVLFDSSPICTLSPGSVFCEDALVSEAPAPASLRALVPSRVAVLERVQLLAALPGLPLLRSALEQAYRRRVLGAALYRIDLFQALSDEARQILLDRFEPVEFPAGALLAKEGERGHAFLFIRSGEARLHLDSIEGGAPPAALDDEPKPPGEFDIDIDLYGSDDDVEIESEESPHFAPLRPGDYLGDTALVDGAPHSATVTAATPLAVLQLTRAAFEEALRPLPAQLEAVRDAWRRRSESMFD